VCLLWVHPGEYVFEDELIEHVWLFGLVFVQASVLL